MTSKAPMAMAAAPMKTVLITVTSTTSPRTIIPARIMTIPSRTQTQKGGVDKLPERKPELLS